MGTHVSIALALLVGSLAVQPHEPMAARIGIDPKPPSVGETITLTAGPNMKLRIEVDPNGVFDVVTGPDGKATFDVPSGAASIIVSDPNGTWTTNTTTVNP